MGIKPEQYYLECIECGSTYQPNQIIYKCEKCGDLLSVKYDEELLKPDIIKAWRKRRFYVWRYRELLPITDWNKIVSLGEGGTNLLKCPRLADRIGLKHVFIKNEGENPTGSFKDRGMTVGVSKALELSVKRVACASTGNTSASLAAYAARAGLECIILIPSGKIAFGKLIQAIVHGARVIQILGNFDEALKIVEEICQILKIYLMNSINPYRLEGQKTIAYEIWEQIGRAPDKIIVPIGNAGNISAIWKGFKELYSIGLINRLPQMIGIQAEGAAPIAASLKKGLETIKFIEKPETLATAIRIGSPVNWKKAVRAIKESNGFVETVSDNEILNAQRILAQTEGLFVEPAGAASIAGLGKLAEMDLVDSDETVVCIATGHGLKDPDIILRQFPKPVEAEANVEAVIKLLALN